MSSPAYAPAPPLDRIVLRPVVDSRPPADPPVRGAVLALAPAGPTLFDVAVTDPSGPPVPTARHRAVLVTVVGAEPPDSGRADPLDWSRRFAPALIEVLQGRRPAAQLTRWVDEPVLAAIVSELRRRQHRRPPGAGLSSAPPAAIHSLRIQCPFPDVVEAAVHVRSQSRSCALAFRLRALSDRWLCTLVDLGDGALWTI